MSISAVTSAPVSPVTPVQTKAPKPDQDRDADDGRSVQPHAQTVPAPSTGKIVDLTA